MGVIHWIFQRCSNAVIILFGLSLLAIVISNGGISQDLLNKMLATTWIKVSLLVVLLVAGVNSVLAGWQISGDYALKFGLNHKLLVGLITAVSVAYVAVGLYLLF